MVREFSAGGVVYKSASGRILWMVAQHSGYGGWIFPKGHIEKGERSEETALREVKEETGIEAKIICKVGDFSYFYTKEGEKVFKNAKFFLMEYVGGDETQHDSETSEILWLPYGEALKRLTFKDEKKMLEKANSFLI